MNKLVKNFKLLLDDIDSIKLTNPLKKEIDKIAERNETLLLYRHLIKNIPKMHNSLLEQKYAYEVSPYINQASSLNSTSEKAAEKQTA
jgi:hypothetical protein